MTFTVLIVSMEQNEEFQESRVHYTLARIESLLKIGDGELLDARGGAPEPLEPSPGSAPAVLLGCLGIKTETYYIEGKKYSLTFFGIYGLTCFELAQKRQVCKARRVV